MAQKSHNIPQILHPKRGGADHPEVARNSEINNAICKLAYSSPRGPYQSTPLLPCCLSFLSRERYVYLSFLRGGALNQPRDRQAHFVGEELFFFPHVRAHKLCLDASFCFRNAAIAVAHPDGPPFFFKNFFKAVPRTFFLIAYCRACDHSLFSSRFWLEEVASITIRIDLVPALTLRLHNFATR